MNELLQANIFRQFSGWNTIGFRGAVTPKLLKFEVSDGEKTRPLYLASIIHKEEKLPWQSCQDLLNHAAALAQTGMQGLFGLEVLSLDIRAGMTRFNAQNFSQLLINHARNLGAIPKTLIRYGQLFCVLHKRAPAEWGKIEVKTHVEIVDPEKSRPESFYKKIFRESGRESGALFLIHDMSGAPVWDMNTVAKTGAWIFHSAQGLIRRPLA